MIEQVLQLVHDALVNNDQIAKLALADLMEEFGMDNHAAEMRNDKALIPECSKYHIQDDDVHVFVELNIKGMVRSAVRRVKGHRKDREARLFSGYVTAKRVTKRNWVMTETQIHGLVIKTPKRQPQPTEKVFPTVVT